ncbi:hypothetical protein TNCT_733691 [Trichonephila clavata]|uniref:Uncharacterized protein n=1 Tax=Trichonephila clavata TaxID=2740835 RepID=A0A8X6IR46_TRICU|nr:hypothetical protein TNCT_733691 [Trichonephila clavata]
MQESIDKELLKKYNITGCYVRLTRYDTKENKTKEQENVSVSVHGKQSIDNNAEALNDRNGEDGHRLQENVAILNPFEEEEREKKPCKDLSQTYFYLGHNYCVDQFKNYLTQNKYRARILAKLNADLTPELRYSNAETNWQYQVNKDLVRMILRTSMSGCNLQLACYSEVVTKAIEDAENQISMEKTSGEVSGIKSTTSFPGSQNRIIHEKNRYQTRTRPERDGNEKKPRERAPFSLNKGLAKSVIFRRLNGDRRKTQNSSVKSSTNENTFRLKDNSKGKRNSVKSSEHEDNFRLNDNSFQLNDNRKETRSSLKSSVAEDNVQLKDSQQNRLTKNQTKGKFLRQHSVSKKNILRSKKSAPNLRTPCDSNGNEHINNKINQSCASSFRYPRVSSNKNIHAVDKKSIQKTNGRHKYLSPISSTFTRKEAKKKEDIVEKEKVERKYSVKPCEDNNKNSSQSCIKLLFSCNTSGKDSEIPETHFDSRLDNDKNEATGENDLDSSLSEKSSESSSEESSNLTSISKEIQRSRRNQENSGRIFDKTKPQSYVLYYVDDLVMRIAPIDLKDGYAENKNTKLKRKQATRIPSNISQSNRKKLQKHENGIQKSPCVNADELNSLNERITQNSDEIIPSSEKGITDTSCSSTYGKETVDKHETILSSSKKNLNNRKNFGKKETGIRSDISDNIEKPKKKNERKKEKRKIPCVNAAELKGQNKKIKRARDETILYSKKGVTDIIYSSTDDKKTEDNGETFEEPEKEKRRIPCVDEGKFSDQNEKINRISDKIISYSEKEITGSNYLTADDKETVDNNETLLTTPSLNKIKNFGKEQTGLWSDISENIERLEETENGKTRNPCVDGAELNGQNKKIKRARNETILYSKRGVTDIIYSSTDDKKTEDNGETFQEPEKEKRRIPCVDDGKFSDQNEKINRISDKIISYSEKEITGSNYLTADDKETVDNNETLLTTPRLNKIKNFGKEQTGIRSDISENIERLEETEKGKTRNSCVDAGKFNVQNEKIKRASYERIPYSGNRVSVIVYASKNNKETVDKNSASLPSSSFTNFGNEETGIRSDISDNIERFSEPIKEKRRNPCVDADELSGCNKKIKQTSNETIPYSANKVKVIIYASKNNNETADNKRALLSTDILENIERFEEPEKEKRRIPCVDADELSDRNKKIKLNNDEKIPFSFKGITDMTYLAKCDEISEDYDGTLSFFSSQNLKYLKTYGNRTRMRFDTSQDIVNRFSDLEKDKQRSPFANAEELNKLNKRINQDSDEKITLSNEEITDISCLARNDEHTVDYDKTLLYSNPDWNILAIDGKEGTRDLSDFSENNFEDREKDKERNLYLDAVELNDLNKKTRRDSDEAVSYSNEGIKDFVHSALDDEETADNDETLLSSKNNSNIIIIDEKEGTQIQSDISDNNEQFEVPQEDKSRNPCLEADELQNYSKKIRRDSDDTIPFSCDWDHDYCLARKDVEKKMDNDEKLLAGPSQKKSILILNYSKCACILRISQQKTSQM